MNDLLAKLQELLELHKYDETQRKEIIRIITQLKGYSKLVDKLNDLAADCDRHISIINDAIHSITNSEDTQNPNDNEKID